MKIAFTLGILAIHLAPAAGQVALKPSGQGALPLSTRAISADVVIRGQFTSTSLNLTFQNQLDRQTEADFLYTLPPDTTLTYFAYWFKDEKVVARVVEKERAAAIYSHITSRNRDPALVEMVGKNTFRARIFPVEANADLKVEIKLVQTLPADSAGATFVLPLQQEQALDSLAVRVHVHPDDLTVRVENNLGVSVVTDEAGYRFAIEGKNYRPQKDLRVRLVRTPQPLQASLYAVRSGGLDGFFALALTPATPLQDPRIAIRGVQTYDLSQIRTQQPDSGRSIVLYGRYRGTGPATITLSETGGREPQQTRVMFEGVDEANNLAAKLWAHHWIEDLSQDSRNRSRVVALSMRHTIPSKYTSWLAVPREEMERYRQEKAMETINSLANTLTNMILDGKGRTRQADQLRSRLKTLCVREGEDADEFVRDRLLTHTWEIGPRLADLIAMGREGSAEAALLRRRLDRLSSRARLKSSRILAYYLQSDLNRAASDYMLTRHSAYLNHRYSSERQTYLRVLERSNQPANPARAKETRARILRLARAAGRSPAPYLELFERTQKEIETEELRDRIAAERRDPNSKPEEISALEERFRALNTELRGRQYADARVQRLSTSIDLDLLNRRAGKSADPEIVRQRSELTRRLGELRARMGDPLIQVDAPADARQVIALMPGGEVKRLEYNRELRRWEARFDIPTYAAEGAYEITIIIVRPNGARSLLVMRYHVDVTSPRAAGRAAVADSRTLRLELDSDENTARVSALLPWGEKVELKLSGQTGRFFALARIPESFTRSLEKVTYIVTDRAHNRTTLTVDLADGR